MTQDAVFGCMINQLILIKSMKFATNYLLKKNSYSENLLPTENALIEHIRRVSYQVFIWKNAIHSMINMSSPVGNEWKKHNGYLVPKYLTRDQSPKNIESLMTCKCTTGCKQIPVDVAKILSVAQKLVHIQKILALISNNGQVVRRAKKNMMAIVTQNVKRKTMMTSYNQRLAIVIINVEGFKDLQIDLHD